MELNLFNLIAGVTIVLSFIVIGGACLVLFMPMDGESDDFE